MLMVVYDNRISKVCNIILLGPAQFSWVPFQNMKLLTKAFSILVWLGSTKMINALKKLVFCILWQNFINQQSGLDSNHGCGEVLAEIIRTLDSTGYETPVKQSFLSKCRRELL